MGSKKPPDHSVCERRIALRSILKRRAGYVLVVNCALGVLLSRANRLLDPANFSLDPDLWRALVAPPRRGRN
jgi:hypothetical protein